MVSIVMEVILSLHIQEVVMSKNLEQIYEPAHKILVLVALSSKEGSDESAQKCADLPEPLLCCLHTRLRCILDTSTPAGYFGIGF